jgi:predicted enzyme related to lactoylglutathione lyase
MLKGAKAHATLPVLDMERATTFYRDKVGAAQADSVEELRGRGITFEEYDTPDLKTVNGIADLGSAGRAAWFKDTEGNTVGVLTINT